ncbi:MAG: cobalamin-dependent protein [Gammaproteobacteria bacterium]|nr:cobalamin-dependent protein [Gammaproteobacteria bacterium]
MTDLHPLTAGMLEASASGYAAAAAAALHRRERGTAAAAAAMAPEQRAYFSQRILELAAAVRMQTPELFVRRAAWLRRALLARGENEAPLRNALLSLREALAQELPTDVGATAIAPIDAALEALAAPPQPDSDALAAEKPGDRLALRYLEACVGAEPERAIGIVLDALRELEPARIITEVLAPAEREIGRLWHAGEAMVAEERLVTETTRQLLTLIGHRSAAPARFERTVIAACVSGNIHDLGVRMAAELYRLAGWRVLFLGTTLPANELARAAATFDADLVIVNATLVTQLRDAADVVESVRRSSGRTRILVGGAAFDEAPDAWRAVGADGYAASLDTVVAAGRALIGE